VNQFYTVVLYGRAGGFKTARNGDLRPAGQYRMAKEAAAAAGVPLMTHHSMSSIPIERCPGELKALERAPGGARPCIFYV
jgi:hypothetical protein